MMFLRAVPRSLLVLSRALPRTVVPRTVVPVCAPRSFATAVAAATGAKAKSSKAATTTTPSTSTSESSSTPKPTATDFTTTKRAPSAKTTAGTTAKATKVKAEKGEKKPKKETLKPWQALDENGKQVPLPIKSKPKKSSAFILYTTERIAALKGQEEFQTVSKSMPSEPRIDIIKLTRHIGTEWNALSADAKRPYEEAYEKQKAEYERALASWHASLTPEDLRRHNAWTTAQRKKGYAIARIRDPAAPKRPLTAFFEFLSAIRAKEGTPAGMTGVQDQARSAGEVWQKMSDAEKENYRAKAQGAREQYLREVEQYKAAHSA